MALRPYLIWILAVVIPPIMAQRTPQRASISSDEATARQALAAGHAKDAEIRYRALLPSDPDSPTLLLGLGLALHLEGRSSEAIPILAKANRIQESPAGLTVLALDYCRLGRYDQADPILERATRYATDPNVLAGLGSCYLDEEQPVQAISIYKKLVDRRIPPQDENAVDLARAYLRASKYFGNLLRKAPGGREYVLILQNAAASGSADARVGFEKAVAAAPYLRPNVTFSEAAALFHDHSHDPALLYLLTVLSGEKAIATITEIQEKYPDSISYRCLHAEILANQGRNEQARREYEEIGNSPDATVTVYHDIAMFYRKTADWNDALRWFRREHSAAPDDERAEVGISESLLKLNEFPAARTFLTPIVAKGNCTWAVEDLSRADERLGNLSEAIRMLKRAEVCDSANSSIHYRLSQLFRQTGDAADATRELKLFSRLRESTSPSTISGKKP